MTHIVTDGCTGISTPDSDEGTAEDGSGYFISVTGRTIQQLLGVNGNSISPASGAGSVVDRNGNTISLSSGVITDTLGQTALTFTGSGTPSSPVTFTFQAPSGANAVYTEKFTSYTVQTNFGCSGISEFGPASENLVSEIDLPDIGSIPNDKYVITYEATPGHAGNVTGRIASITLPTGGTISYSYSGGSNGITCADGSTATLTRTTPDGTWTYAHSESGTAWTTTVTDPSSQHNQTVYNFQGIYQTERKVYQGTSAVLEDDVTCYNGNTTFCNTTAFTLPINERIVTKTLGNEVCKHVYLYNSKGMLTEQDDYDYGNGGPGGLIRKELVTYASLGNNIADAPSQVKIEDGSGTIVAQTTVTYDESTPAATSGTPQHISVTGSRGNPTTVQYLVAGTTNLTKSFKYFDTGNIQTATDVNGAPTTFTYGACGNSFPTLVTEPLSLTKSMTWNCIGGVETSATDENGKTVSATYSDANFWRPATSTDQESNVTNFSYPSPTSVESSMAFNGTASAVDILKTLDSLGRVQVTQQREAPGSTNFDSNESDYDSVGRPSRATVPYIGIANGTNGSAPATTRTYDALNRPLVTTDAGNGTVTLSYSANDVLQTIGPAPSGENTKRRQSEYNSIGELTSVCEITGISGSGTCGQTTSATGYWTKYTYDALGDLTGVSQNAQSPQVQTRSFAYDALGRMTSETNPETGAIAYVYDSDSTCGNSKGDLVKKTDAAGNVSCYAYDALHRKTSITYSGPNSGNTPSKFFVYDTATVNGFAMTNATARLAEAYTCVSPCSSKLTDQGFSYTARGEVQDVYESTPHSSGYFHVDDTYWANGALDVVSGLSGLPTLTYAPDGEGRVKSVSASSGQNPVSSTTYNVASEATGVTLGSGDSDAFTFDPNTFRMTQYKFTVGATPQSVVDNLTWNANGTLGSLNITDPFNAANTQNCTYSYDDLARIASGNCGSVWSQTFSYDAFGNITKSGNSQFQPGYNLNNQMISGASYDANGDVLSDSLHSYAWDVETRPTTIDSVAVTYDALGRVVEQNKSGTYTEIVYAPTGNKLALMNGVSTLKQAFVPLPAGATAVYNAGGLQYYRHPDWLGNSRFASTPGRALYNDLAFAPFGEQYAAAGTTGVTNTSFAGNNEDTTTNLYDAQFREYGIQGRWPSPDPAGIAAANPANPQSWNRYAYVLNNPLAFIDTSGFNPNGPNQPAVMEDGSGGEVDGCDEFDWANAWCKQTMQWEDPNWSPFGINFKGTINGEYINYTFDTWDQYAEWHTYVAAGAPDPCVYMNDSATAVESIDNNSSPGECSATGGTWVVPGFTPGVDKETGTVTSSPPQQQGSWWNTPGLGRNTLKGATEGGLIGGAWGCGVGMVVGAGPETPAGWAACGVVGLGGVVVGFGTGAVGGAWDYYFP
ncbi:MAG TPA: RHS repeat-associated core domain-containing protein [Candidatus Acidoferrales bacterium]|nr:RHS repeat-associated core domain-containing protein [Candidatus Acidoferrales bacterium]